MRIMVCMRPTECTGIAVFEEHPATCDPYRMQLIKPAFDKLHMT